MAEQLRIGDALNETFQFAVQRWLTILRLGWAPLLMAMLISTVVAMGIFDFAALRALEDDPNGLLQFADYVRLPIPAAILLGVLAMVAVSLIVSGFMASVFRLVALGEEQPGFFNIRVDGPAMRVFVAQWIITAIICGIFLVALLVGSLLTGITMSAAFGSISEFFRIVAESAAEGTQPAAQTMRESVAPMGLFGVAFLLSIIPMIFVNIRLAPFMAGSAVENRLLLAGSFSLTKGKFWSLFGYYLLLALSLMAIGIIYNIVFSIVDVLTSLPAGGLFGIIALLANLFAIALTLAYQIFTMALQLGGQGIIYRRLKTGA